MSQCSMFRTVVNALKVKNTALEARVLSLELNGVGGDPESDDAKQDLLENGINIKTINGESILGAGNLEIIGGGGGDIVIDSVVTEGSSNAVSGNAVFEELELRPPAVDGVYPSDSLPDVNFSDTHFAGDGVTTAINIDPAIALIRTSASDLTITDSDKGIILTSPNDHIWRITVNNSGALVITDITV